MHSVFFRFIVNKEKMQEKVAKMLRSFYNRKRKSKEQTEICTSFKKCIQYYFSWEEKEMAVAGKKTAGVKDLKAAVEKAEKKVAEAAAKKEEVKKAEAAKAEAPKAAAKKAEAPKAAAKKAEAPKAAAKKAEAPKAAAKKAEAPKAAAKKTAEPKVKLVVEYQGGSQNVDELIAKAKEAAGKKSIKELNIYYQPENNIVYFTADGAEGSYNL